MESVRGLTDGSAIGLTILCTFSFSFSFVSCRTSGRSNPPTLESSSCAVTVFEIQHLTL